MRARISGSPASSTNAATCFSIADRHPPGGQCFDHDLAAELLALAGDRLAGTLDGGLVPDAVDVDRDGERHGQRIEQGRGASPRRSRCRVRSRGSSTSLGTCPTMLRQFLLADAGRLAVRPHHGADAGDLHDGRLWARPHGWDDSPMTARASADPPTRQRDHVPQPVADRHRGRHRATPTDTGIYGVVHKRRLRTRHPAGRRPGSPGRAVPLPGRRPALGVPAGLPSAVGQAASPEEIAAIELAEETGLRAERLTVLGFLHDAYGGRRQRLPRRARHRSHPGADRPGAHRAGHAIGLVHPRRVWSMIADGRMTDSASVAALALLGRHERPA